MAASDVAGVLLKLLDVANPLAGAVTEFVAGKLGLSGATSDAIQATIAGADPVKLKQIAADLQDHLASYGVNLQIVGLQAQTGQVTAVNQTLQADARGDSWLQKNHHAIESLFCCGLIGSIYFILPLAGVPVPSVPESAWLMLGALLGVTAWQHGQVNQTIASK